MKLNISKNKKLKFGSLATALTVIFVVAVIVVNYIFNSLAQKYMWYSDFTESEIYSVSDKALEYLENVKSNITIKFLYPLDSIKSNYNLNMVYNCAKEYEKASDLITVEYFDAEKNPTQANKYKEGSAADWAYTNVIVESGSKFLVYSVDAFFSVSSSTNQKIGFSGERKFVSSFLQLAGYDLPIVYLTTGHKESNESYADFTNLIKDYGYDVREIDLTKEEISKDANLVIILDPLNDFISKDSTDLTTVSEIDKLSSFLKDDFGSIMMFKGPYGASTPVLDEFLSEWGIKINANQIIYDTASAANATGNIFFGTSTTEGVGASIQEKFRDIKTIFRNSASIDMLYTEKDAINVSGIYTTANNAIAIKSDKETQTGKYNLMTLSAYTKYVDNTKMNSYLCACSSPEMLNYISSTAYANKNLYESIVTVLTKAKVPIDLDYKPFEETALTLESSQANGWTITLVCVIPLIVLGMGCFVWIRRKYK